MVDNVKFPGVLPVIRCVCVEFYNCNYYVIFKQIIAQISFHLFFKFAGIKFKLTNSYWNYMRKVQLLCRKKIGSN